MSERNNSTNILKGLNYVAGQAETARKTLTRVTNSLQEVSLLTALRSERVQKKLNLIRKKIRV